MAVNNVYHVIYGYRDGNKKHAWDGQQTDLVMAADSKEDTLRSVLSSNGRARPGATIDILNVTQISGNVLS